MIYRRFGLTDKEVSVLGFGGMRFGPDEEKGAELVRRVLEKGINYIDTAPTYCDARSESIIGRGIRGWKEPFYLSTKTTFNDDPTADAVRRRIDASLERFGVGTITFLYMWGVNSLDVFKEIMAPGGAYEGAMRARDAGLIEHICISSHASGRDIGEMIAGGGFAGVTLGYNVVNAPFRRDGIEEARARQMAVVVMSPLGGGLIPNATGARLWEGRRPPASNYDPVGTALRFVANTPGVTVVLSGMECAEEVDRNAESIETPGPPRADDVALLQERFAPIAEDFCTFCFYCMSCPEGIVIPGMLKLYDWHRAGVPDVRSRWAEAADSWFEGVRAGACTGCGTCEERCPVGLPIIDRLTECADLFED